VLAVTDRDVALTGEYQGRRRMTLTYPAIDAAGEVLWIVTGGDKRVALETSQPGVFAIGDVRSGSVKRVAAAVGEGAQAVASVHAYLAADEK